MTSPNGSQVRVEQHKLTDVLPDPKNANKHKPRGASTVEKSLRQRGFFRPTAAFGKGVDKPVMGAGNLTQETALSIGMEDAIFVYTDGSRPIVHVRTDIEPGSKEAQALALEDNRAAELSLDWDVSTLASFDADVLGDLWTPAELSDLGQQWADEQKRNEQDPGAQIDKAEELQAKWHVKPGDLWAMNDHRLICGDCTDAATVARVMGSEKAEMVWTDPPYGVSVGDKNKYLNSIARSNRIEENLENDTLDEPGIVAMLCGSFDNALAHCTAGAAWYVAAPAVPLHLLFGQVLKERGIWRQTIQWVKNNSTFSPMGVCYHWQAEPIFFGWIPNAGHRWYGGRTQTTVWNIDRPSKSPEHPTMKPVELVERAIENSSRTGEIALDPFLGSGTTLIACERLSRKCRAVEISPAYVAVALQRWADMTGKTPTLVQGNT